MAGTDREQARPFGTRHPGELAVRERLDIPGALDPRLPTVRSALDPRIAYFLMQQQLLVISALGPDGRIWVTAWSGPEGFIFPAAPRVLAVEGAWTVAPGDPVVPLLTEGTAVGLVCVDFETRSRVRINGSVLEGGEGRLALLTEQVYGNCPKYIQQRTYEPVRPRGSRREPAIGTGLTEAQAAVLRRADSFFIGTAVPGTGTDASHRGGLPGFVRVSAPSMLSWPDYPGNRMFMTLGNLELHGYAGIVVPVWDDGTLIHVSGRARVVWGPPGDPADRQVELTVEKVVERRHAVPLRWTFHSYSPANPPVEPGPAAPPS